MDMDNGVGIDCGSREWVGQRIKLKKKNNMKQKGRKERRKEGREGGKKKERKEEISTTRTVFNIFCLSCLRPRGFLLHVHIYLNIHFMSIFI